MMRKVFFGRVGLALVVLLLATFMAMAQSNSGAAAGARGSAGVVKAQGYVSTDGIRPGDKFKVAVALDIAPGYHVQGHQPSAGLIATEVQFVPVAGLTIKEPTYPAPKYLKLESLGLGDEGLAVHDGTIYVTADAEADRSIKPGPLEIRARYTVQACNDRVCLAPDTIDLAIPVKVMAATEAVKAASAEVFAKAEAQPALDATAIRPATGDLTQFGGSSSRSSLFDKGIVSILIGVFLAGLALNLTPCVYPIIPITVGFFVNQSAAAGKPRLSRTFAMASMYVIGMALTYSILGAIAPKSGGLFGAALQNPIVLVALAAVMVALSLSMFGLYEIRVPQALNRFANSSTQSSNGPIGALVMGLTMGIVAAPCIGPFLLALPLEVETRVSAPY